MAVARRGDDDKTPLTLYVFDRYQEGSGVEDKVVTCRERSYRAFRDIVCKRCSWIAKGASEKTSGFAKRSRH